MQLTMLNILIPSHTNLHCTKLLLTIVIACDLEVFVLTHLNMHTGKLEMCKLQAKKIFLNEKLIKENTNGKDKIETL